MRRTVALLILLSISACSGRNNNEKVRNLTNVRKQPTKTINIIGHWLNEGKREKLVRDMANEFEFLNQEYKVNLVFPEQLYYNLKTKSGEKKFVSDLLVKKTQPWDIIRINDDYYGIADSMKDPDWPKKYLVDFSKINEFKQNTIHELLSDSSIINKWGGIIPGPFLEGFNWSIWYNKQLAKEVGIDVKQFNMTCDDFLGYVRSLNEYNKKYNKHIIPIYESNNWSTIYILALQAYFSEIEDPNEILNNHFSEKKLVAWDKTLHFIESLAKENAWNYDWNDMIWDKTLDLPLHGKVMFYINASWMYNIWEKIDKNLVTNMVPAELPQFKPSKIYSGGYMVTWAVPKNAPNKEEAIRFLLFINQPDIAELWSRITKCPTGIKGNLTSVSFGFDQFEDFNYVIGKKYGTRKINYIDDARLVLGSSLRNIDLQSKNVAFGEKTADRAMKEIRKELKMRMNYTP